MMVLESKSAPARFGQEHFLNSLWERLARRRDKHVVLIVRSIERIEVAALLKRVDVFFVVAEGEIVENVQLRRLIGADCRRSRLRRSGKQNANGWGSHCHLRRGLNEGATRLRLLNSFLEIFAIHR